MIQVVYKPHPSKYRFSEILVGDEVFRSLATAQVKNSDLEGSYVSYEAWVLAWDQWETKQIKAIAYDRLSRRTYFTHELKQLISKLGFDNDRIEAILTEIQKIGYLNDAEGVDRYIQQGIRKKKSPSWIRHHLRQKVGGDIEFDKEVAYPKELRESVIRELLVKNIKKGQKSIALVARKGFSFDEIITIYNTLHKNNGMIDEF